MNEESFGDHDTDILKGGTKPDAKGKKRKKKAKQKKVRKK
jgi:hypothetical protein